MSEELINAMVELRDDELTKLVKEQLKTRNPMDIFEDLREGITKVGDLFEQQEYFLSDLVFAGDIFNETSELLLPHFPKDDKEFKGKVVIGTVQGDFHDIGKNITITLLKSNGYDVIDLGIDVSAERFLEAVQKYEPNVLGMSGLLTTATEPMKRIIGHIRKEYKNKLMIIVGGGRVNDEWVKIVGADYGANNAVTGLKIINEVMKRD